MPASPPPTRSPDASAPRCPVPKATLARIELAEDALRLRDEQLAARIVYFEPEIQTNAELDAITAQVVADLKALQQQQLATAPAMDSTEIEIALIKGLRQLLEKMVSSRREAFVRHKIELIQRKITNLFFTSEVYANPSAAESAKTTFGYADEALFHVLHHNAELLEDELTSLSYERQRVRDDAIERLRGFQKQLVSETLARSRPAVSYTHLTLPTILRV